MADEPRPLIEIGYVARAHGIRGEICAVPHDPESTTLEEIEQVFLGEEGTAYQVLASRPVNDGYLLRLAGVVDRNAAERLRGSTVSVDRSTIPLEEGEVFLSDLIGFACQLPDGSAWGEITGIEMGFQDRLVVRHGDVERLLPYVDAFVGEVDVEKRIVHVTPPEGLPEERIR
jgi:16S rRNA processing protein RimM